MPFHLINGRLYEERDGAYHPVNGLETVPVADYALSDMPQTSALAGEYGNGSPLDGEDQGPDGETFDRSRIAVSNPPRLPGFQRSSPLDAAMQASAGIGGGPPVRSVTGGASPLPAFSNNIGPFGVGTPPLMRYMDGGDAPSATIAGPTNPMKFNRALATAPRRTGSSLGAGRQGGAAGPGLDVDEMRPNLMSGVDGANIRDGRMLPKPVLEAAPPIMTRISGPDAARPATADEGLTGRYLTTTPSDDTKAVPSVYSPDGATPPPQMVPVKLNFPEKLGMNLAYRAKRDLRTNIKTTFEKIAGRSFTEDEIKTILSDVANGKSTTRKGIESLPPGRDGKFTPDQISTINTYINELPNNPLNKSVRSGWNAYLNRLKGRR